MTPDQKIAYIEKQIEACRQDRTNAINCPYCHNQNVEGQQLCCNLLGRAVAAILLRKDLHAKKEQAERIAEGVSRN